MYLNFIFVAFGTYLWMYQKSPTVKNIMEKLFDKEAKLEPSNISNVLELIEF
jgi:hypothetical protein